MLCCNQQNEEAINKQRSHNPKKIEREIIRKIKTNYLLVYNLDTGYIKSYFSLS
jgi:hypothetical protein